jgi:hypothetical protein
LEAQGRENLYDLTLPNGDVLRSINRFVIDVALNDDVEWSVSGDRILSVRRNRSAAMMDEDPWPSPPGSGWPVSGQKFPTG